MGDGMVLKSIIIDRKSKIQNVEVNISDVDFLQIVGRCPSNYGYDDYYSLIINPYLYY